MNRVFDPIDIIFIVLIGIYLLTLFAIILILVYGKKEVKQIERYKVIKIIHRPKNKKKKNNNAQKKKSNPQPKKKTSTNKTNNNQRYKGKAATKKKPTPRKKKPKTNGVNKKRKK